MANAYSYGTKLRGRSANLLPVRPEWSAQWDRTTPFSEEGRGVHFPREGERVATPNRWVAGWCPTRNAWAARSFSVREKVWRAWVFRSREAMESFLAFLESRDWELSQVGPAWVEHA